MRLTFRRARFADWCFLLSVRNDPIAVVMSPSPTTIPLEEHLRWLRQALADPQTTILIACRGRYDLGMGKMVTVADTNGVVTTTFSVIVDARMRGRGLSTAIIRRLLKDAPTGVLEAHIKRDNYASMRAFLACGFELDETSLESRSRFITFTKERT